jgi:hypothetical protein|tara:strand:+ start:665 stop:880 length:216 start_codon:yes stop_codon:yes gene_type:complete
MTIEETDNYYNEVVKLGIATTEELELAIFVVESNSMQMISIDSMMALLNSVIFHRTGFHDLKQYKEIKENI